ncbi:flavodoxin family protein [Lolliginicoccus suaedae]|uniref:flavodoxin family protein n=1 Tax=Lolliginicoccus suaedae TaxID=2605429 RepID=UPI0011ECD50B|nr:NAD(P)H-dependent oxidoreductase [Lolliginicoccus suaedae]
MTQPQANQPRALALACSLKPSSESSSSDLLARQILDALAEHGVRGSSVRVADHVIPPGVGHEMSDDDAWPAIREEVLASDVLLLCTPIWLGHPSSLAQRVLERLNADLSETGEDGRPIMFDKVAVVGIVGNEDGAHKVTADLFQGLADLGFTVPAHGSAYWVGEARGGTDYQDLDEMPAGLEGNISNLARNAAHLAGLLSRTPYPAPPSD